MFAIFFNISAVLVAWTGFFPNALWSDAFGIGTDPEQLPTANNVFTILVTKPTGEIAKLWGYNLTISVIMGTIAAFSLGVSIVTKQTSVIAMGLVGYLFWTMYSNSKGIFQEIIADLGGSAYYIALMISLGIAIMFVITLMDYAAGQRSGSKS